MVRSAKTDRFYPAPADRGRDAVRVHADVGGPVGALYRDLTTRIDPVIASERAQDHVSGTLVRAMSRTAGYAMLFAGYAAIASWLLG